MTEAKASQDSIAHKVRACILSGIKGTVRGATLFRGLIERAEYAALLSGILSAVASRKETGKAAADTARTYLRKSKSKTVTGNEYVTFVTPDDKGNAQTKRVLFKDAQGNALVVRERKASTRSGEKGKTLTPAELSDNVLNAVKMFCDRVTDAKLRSELAARCNTLLVPRN